MKTRPEKCPKCLRPSSEVTLIYYPRAMCTDCHIQAQKDALNEGLKRPKRQAGKPRKTKLHKAIDAARVEWAKTHAPKKNDRE